MDKRNSLSKRIKQNRVAYIMLLPTIVGFIAFVLYPQLWVLRLAFYKYNGYTPPVFVGMDNFVRLFTRDTVWWKAVGNTFYFSTAKLLVEIPLALILAVILNNNLKGRNLFRTVYFLPNVTSTAVMSLVFYFIFSPYQGILNGILQSIGIISEPIDWLGQGSLAMIVCMIVSIWQNFGLNMILFLAGLQSIPDEIYESADIDGATPVQQFIHLTIPMLGRMLQIILMLAIIGSLKTFDLFKVLTNGGPGHDTEVMMTYIFRYFFVDNMSTTAQPQLGYASSMGLVATIIIGAVTAVYLWMSRKLEENY